MRSCQSCHFLQTGRSPAGKGRKRQVTSSGGATPPTKKIKTEEGGGGGETSTSEESQTVLDTSTSQELSSQVSM